MQEHNLVGKKILLADDDPANIEVLASALKPERFNLFTVLDGEKALEVAIKNIPDLIVLDVIMPGMNGFETCQKLKENELTHDIPIIFISAKSERENIEKGFSLGCVEYITKPFQVDEVCNRIRTHLILGEQKYQEIFLDEEDPAVIAGMKVMIVEDNPLNIDILKKALEAWDLDLFIATNGKIAVDFTDRAQPDLILLDVMMPEMNGFEACRTIKQNPLTKHIPIIFITAKHEPEDIEKGFSLGCADYITKPFNLPELRARVKSHLMLRKLIIIKESCLKQLEVFKSQLEAHILERTIKLQEEKDKAELASQAKTAFIMNMVHELRTPMNAILGFAHLIEVNMGLGDNSSQESNFQYMREAGKHLLALINDVLDLSRIESGETNISMEKVNPFQIINDKVIPLTTSLAQEQGITLINKILDPAEVSVQCDPLRLTQILINLTTNAIKYNKQGGEVTFGCQQPSEDTVRITVTDTGQGIPKEKLETIFVPFHRLEINPPTVEGMGIGLTISKALVEVMGGKIIVESVPGEGTCFSIELACRKN